MVILIFVAILGIRFARYAIVSGTDYSALDGEYKDVQQILDLVSQEKGLMSVLLMLTFLRSLKLLRIAPSTGAVIQSIMDVRFVIFMLPFRPSPQENS